MDRWKDFHVGRHVQVVSAGKFYGRYGRIVDIRSIGPLHFIDVVVGRLRCRSTFRPAELRRLNILEELARVDGDLPTHL